jgi:16S rRNA C967 or C1407 C5-methylase (RsmB/RsmF family)/NOL1/NOP2/fmu family ribosome biogenesis protein
MLPEKFIQRIKSQKYIDSDSLVKALDEPSPVSIRLNPSKWNLVPDNSHAVPWCPRGYYLSQRPSFTLDPLFNSGCYYPQEASGMFLEQVIAQTSADLKNVRVLDLCGAPGGKSTHISDLLGPGSLLVANETIRQRADILKETITRWGSGNTMVTRNDPAAFGKLSGYFDVILVDAPCSGEGMFRNKPAVNEWSQENAAHCSERQKRILMDIWPSLKENGVLIYSTCTFNPAENEENIKWLITKSDSVSVSLNVADFSGITVIEFQGITGYGFYPGKSRGEGFFLSVIRKTCKQENTPVRSLKKTEFKPGKNELVTAEKWIQFTDDRILKWGNEIFSLPCSRDEYSHLFHYLKVVKPGTKLFTVKNNDCLPTHELSLSQLLKKDAFPEYEIELREAIGFLRRDKIVLNNIQDGWNLLRYKGVNLGFVKNIGNRVNNYFPVEWRIRMDIPDAGKENILQWKNDL